MSKCIGDCARCELPVDKNACCAFQTFKNILEVKARLKTLEEKVEVLENKVVKDSEVIQYTTLEDLDNVESN
jgi:hypothetical protein